MRTESLCDLADDCGEMEDEDKDLCTGYHLSTFDDGFLGWFNQGEDSVDDDVDWWFGSGLSVSISKCVKCEVMSGFPSEQ